MSNNIDNYLYRGGIPRINHAHSIPVVPVDDVIIETVA